MKILSVRALLAASALMVFSTGSFADVIYSVSSTSQLNCSPDGEHGLWTNGDKWGDGSCGNYFDFDSSLSTLTIFNSDADSSNWTAVLSGVATNPADRDATINLTFSNFSDDHTLFDVKNGGGASAAEIADWIFFRDVQGTIEIEGVNTFNVNDNAGNTGFQIGLGANDKTPVFGASAWINGDFPAGHWDINVELETVGVPEPGYLGLLGLGLVIVGLRRRKLIRS